MKDISVMHVHVVFLKNNYNNYVLCKFIGKERWDGVVLTVPLQQVARHSGRSAGHHLACI